MVVKVLKEVEFEFNFKMLSSLGEVFFILKNLQGVQASDCFFMLQEIVFLS